MKKAKDKRQLFSILGSEKKSLGYYLPSKEIELKDSDERKKRLNTNHTHFILVDSHEEEKYGGEIELRGKLEGAISKKWEENNRNTVQGDTSKLSSDALSCLLFSLDFVPFSDKINIMIVTCVIS